MAQIQNIEDLRKSVKGRKDKRPTTTSPAAPPGAPEYPKGQLDYHGKAEWFRVTKELDALGTLSTVDRSCLVNYCRCWARYKQAETELNKHGFLLIEETGQGSKKYKKNPAISVIENAQALMLQYLKNLGLTPLYRPRIHKDPKTQQSKMNDLLVGGRG
jgi:P27 family predicted phage terminase small subunit